MIETFAVSRDMKAEYTIWCVKACCPFDGEGDEYTVDVTVHPDESLPEAESLKAFFNQWEDREVTQENLAAEAQNILAEEIGGDVAVRVRGKHAGVATVVSVA